MRLVLEHRLGRRKDDVGQQCIFGVQQSWPVQGGDHRRFDVEDVRENLATLAQDLVVALRAEEIEALRADCVHESVAATGQDHYAIGVVLADRVEQMDELLVGVAVEDQLAAVSVQGDRKSTRLNSSHVRISYAVFCLKKKKNKYTRQRKIGHV